MILFLKIKQNNWVDRYNTVRKILPSVSWCIQISLHFINGRRFFLVLQLLTEGTDDDKEVNRLDEDDKSSGENNGAFPEQEYDEHVDDYTNDSVNHPDHQETLSLLPDSVNQ